jgi:hypothetical protein
MNLPADGIQVTINSQKLTVYRCGDVYRLMKSGNWKYIENTDNSHGYNLVVCCKKMFMRHRIIAYAYLNLDIEDTTQCIDHINGDLLCNHLDNLRIVSHKENQHNRTKAKGYYWSKQNKKWHAKIAVNYKTIHLGHFDTEQEAHTAYIQAKLIHHPSAPSYSL